MSYDRETAPITACEGYVAYLLVATWMGREGQTASLQAVRRVTATRRECQEDVSVMHGLHRANSDSVATAALGGLTRSKGPTTNYLYYMLNKPRVMTADFINLLSFLMLAHATIMKLRESCATEQVPEPRISSSQACPAALAEASFEEATAHRCLWPRAQLSLRLVSAI